MTFEEVMTGAVQLFEAAGVLILVVGSLLTLVSGARIYLTGQRQVAYEAARQGIGRAVLLGLEILIIADIIQTVILDPTLGSAATLGVIVLVRIVLSFSLEIELQGRLPWRVADAAVASSTGAADVGARGPDRTATG